MGLELGGKPVPKPLADRLVVVRDRVSELTRKYKSLANWGRPYLVNVEEVAVIYYVNEVLGVSLDRLAHFIGVDKTALYKLVKRVAEENKVTIYNEKEGRIEVITVRPEELKGIAESLLGVTTKARIQDPFQSTIIKSFWERDIPKRTKIAGKPAYLDIEDKKETLRVVRRLMEYFDSKGLPTNPDLWEEVEVEKALWEIYKEYPKVAAAMIALRRVPEWSRWFEGKIGAVTKRINPQSRAIFYEDYLKLKKLWKEGKLEESEFLVLWLHLVTGAREGWEVKGVSLRMPLEEAPSSLVGLKWENYDTKLRILKVYESKTNKWWETDVTWLDPEVVPVFEKHYREKGSVVGSITGKKTIGEFQRWYTKTLSKVSELLNLPYRLIPHDIRRSHISILAELGVPLEVACGGLLGFGVGWEDLKTAYIFYLRFSRHLKERVLNEIRERQRSFSTL
jgi:integrase